MCFVIAVITFFAGFWPALSLATDALRGVSKEVLLVATILKWVRSREFELVWSTKLEYDKVDEALGVLDARLIYVGLCWFK